jgi:hypothetical protein
MVEELFKSVILHLSYMGGLAESVNTLIRQVRVFTVFTGSPLPHPLIYLGHGYFYHAVSALPISD